MSLLAVAVEGRGLVDPAEPVFRADDEALLRGSAAFETLPVYGGRPFELEPVGRGASMGALGRIWPNGDLELALTIRTFAIADGAIHLWVGGGVVWDSDPAGEVEESWVKARPLLAAIGAPLQAPVR